MSTPEQPTTADEKAEEPKSRLILLLSSVVTVAFLSHFQFRLEVVRGADVYYHLAVAREMLASGPLQSFPWTPYSLFAERFADKEFLFHVLLMPLASLDIVSAGQLGALFGQVAVVGALATILWRWRTPLAPLVVLGLCAIGPPLPVRLSMCRPHTFTLAFSLIVLGLLCSRRPRLLALFLCAGLHGLFHSGGWLSVAFAGLYGLSALLALDGQKRRLDWQPIAATAAGWLAGQLLHPNAPANFEVLWLQNVVVPLGASSAGSTALSAALGGELMPSSAAVVLSNLPTLALLSGVSFLLISKTEYRGRRTVTTWLSALVFTVIAIFFMRRMWELAGPLTLLAAAALLTRSSSPGRLYGPRRRLIVLALSTVLLLGSANSYHFAGQWITDKGAPVAMSKWLAREASPGDLIYSAQWGDSAPLMWFAPELRSLVALDPTFLYVKDPELFLAYAATITGDDLDPIGTITTLFKARYLTIWKLPVFSWLSEMAHVDERATKVYEDRHYQVFEINEPPLSP